MTRLLTVLGAYLAACLVGAILFSAYWLVTWGPPDSAFTVFWLSLVLGAVLPAPVAIPVVLATEAMRRGAWWMFFAGGIAVAGLLLSRFVPDLEAEPTLLALTICPIAALTYWTVAWRLFPRPPLNEHIYDH